MRSLHRMTVWRVVRLRLSNSNRYRTHDDLYRAGYRLRATAWRFVPAACTPLRLADTTLDAILLGWSGVGCPAVDRPDLPILCGLVMQDRAVGEHCRGRRQRLWILHIARPPSSCLASWWVTGHRTPTWTERHTVKSPTQEVSVGG